jgi:pyrroline-5-carboxylate reductase
MKKVGFIGGGNMAEALIKGIIASGLYPPGQIGVSDISDNRLEILGRTYGVLTLKDNRALAEDCGILILSVKPQNLQEVLSGIKGAVRPETLVISIAAGKKISSVTGGLGDVPVVRVMPNTPALIGEGASALAANEKAQPFMEKAIEIFAAVGKAVVIECEDLMDAVTAVSGSGPAYYFLLTEELMKAACGMNLPAETARTLVLQTAKGACMLAAEASARGEGPESLRQKVTSPGGTTEAAIEVLKKHGLGPAVDEAVKAALARGRQLSGG